MAGGSTVPLRRTIAADAGWIGARAVGPQDVLHVAGNVKIEPSVAVVIEKCGGYGEPADVCAALARDLGERAVVVVAVQLIGAEVRQVQVDPSVVVDVAGSDTHPVRIRADSAARGDVDETHRSRAVSVHCQVVAEEAAAGRAG